MNSHDQKALSIFEYHLLMESETTVSSLLGIRVHIKPRQSPGGHGLVGSHKFWRVTWKWVHIDGQFRFLVSDDLFSELFYPDNPDQDADTQQVMVRKYLKQFSSNFTKRINQFFEETWELEFNETVYCTDMINPLETFRIQNHYAVYLGNRLTSSLDVGIHPALLRRWWNRWQVLSGHRPFAPWPFETAAQQVQLPAHLFPDQFSGYDSLEVELPISAELGKTRIQFSHLIGLGPGDVVHLDKIKGDPVDLYLNSNKFAEGCIISCNGKIGIRVTALIGLKDRMNQFYHVISS